MTIRYTTSAGPQRCIKTDAFSTSKEAVCFVRKVLGAVGPVFVERGSS